jgi:hypothetical protein
VFAKNMTVNLFLETYSDRYGCSDPFTGRTLLKRGLSGEILSPPPVVGGGGDGDRGSEAEMMDDDDDSNATDEGECDAIGVEHVLPLIRAMGKWLLRDGVTMQARAFRVGLAESFDVRIMRAFSRPERRMLICGEQSIIWDFALLRRCLQFRRWETESGAAEGGHGASVSSSSGELSGPPLWLIQELVGYDQAMRTKFLKVCVCVCVCTRLACLSPQVPVTLPACAYIILNGTHHPLLFFVSFLPTHCADGLWTRQHASGWD